MKAKTRDLLFFFVLFLLLTAACMLGLRCDPYQTVAVGQDAPGFPGITVSISSETFTTKEFLLTYTVTNDTDREFLADTSPRIERQRSDGQWEYRVDRRTGTVSGQRAYLPSGDNVVLFPGKTSSPVEISLKQYWPSLKEGTYRLALDYHSDEGYYTAYAVFTVA